MDTFHSIIAEHNDPCINSGIERPIYLDKLERFVALKEIVALVGIRRAGKSTLLRQLQSKIRKSSRESQATVYINFEDPRLEQIDDGSKLLKLIQSYDKRYSKESRVIFFLDELDGITGWEKALNFYHENNERLKFFISGSNSQMLSGSLSTTLSGRFVTLQIYPLNFLEFKTFLNSNQSELDVLRKYLEWGSFPRIALIPDSNTKNELLSNYLSTIVEKDLIIRHRIKKTEELRKLVKYVLLNPTRLFSSYNLSKVLKITDVTVNKYVSMMEQAFIVKRIAIYSPSVKKQIYNPDKIIVADNGLSKIAGVSGGEALGSQLENSMGNALLRDATGELFYWKNGTEIDYVRSQGKQLDLFNITVSIDEESTYRREIDSLHIAELALPGAKKHLLTLFNSLARSDSAIENVVDYL